MALALTADVTITLDHERAPESPSMGPLIERAVESAYQAADRAVPQRIDVAWESDLPIARGLGASAAGRAAGLVGANALMGEPLSLDELLALGSELEGHADNMAPALFGGLQISVHDQSGWQRLAVPLSAGLKVVLFVPDFKMPTRESRAKLPQHVSREDAVHNVGRASLLVAALAQGRWDLLGTATQDRLHQPARGEIFTALDDIIDTAMEAGAHAAYLSGGGSTVAALATGDEERISRLMQQVATASGYSGRSMITEPSATGAAILRD